MSRSHPDSLKRNPIRRAFKAQVDSSKQRGIEFLFTYPRWVAWWEAQLGPDWFNKRGKGKGKYCMARIGDEGPYVEWNVVCMTFEGNCLDRMNTGTQLKGEAHGMCKFNAKLALAIYKAEGSKSEIAKRFSKYGVTRYNVSNIKSGSNWRHVTGHQRDK